MLAQIANAQICVAVAGTHGKTTTLALLTHIFKTAQWPFTAFVGGILEGYKTNYIHTGNRYVLVEADEFDRSFLQLQPSFAAITSLDPDHLDIYDSPKAFQEAFETFAAQVTEVTVLGPEVALKGLRIGEAYQEQNHNRSDGNYNTAWHEGKLYYKGKVLIESAEAARNKNIV